MLAGAVLGTDEARAADKVRVSTSPYLTSAVMHIAAGDGFFAAEGIEIEFVSMPNANRSLPLLVGGRVDVLPGMITSGFVNAVARGARIRIVASRGQSSRSCATTGWVARRETVESGRLTDLSSLRGLRTDAKPSSPAFIWYWLLLRDAGLEVDDFAHHPIPNEVKSAVLLAGGVDVVKLTEPWLTRALDSDSLVLWRGVDELYPGRQFSFIAFGERLLDREPDLGRRFLKAFVAASEHVGRVGKTERNVEIVSRVTRLDPSLVRRACWPMPTPGSHIDAETLNDFQAFALEQGQIDAVLPLDLLIDRSLLPGSPP